MAEPALPAAAAAPVTTVDCGAGGRGPVRELPGGEAAAPTRTNCPRPTSQVARTSGREGGASNRPTPPSQHAAGCSPQQ